MANPGAGSESTTANAGTASMLAKQLKYMQNNKDLPGVSCGLVRDNVFEWEVMLMINDETKYYGGKFLHRHYPRTRQLISILTTLGGNFRCHLSFPPTYPMMPPSLKFLTPVPFHPNIYPDGRLCISILHAPGEDQYGYEKAEERWSPAQTPETILVSVLSLLNDPNDESPANIEAARLWREEKKDGNKEFKKRCGKILRESLGDY